MLILSYPTFKNKVCIGPQPLDGPQLWFIGETQLLTAAQGLADFYLAEENASREELALRPLSITELRQSVLSNLGRNKMAVAVGVEDDGLVYLYSEDGKLYLASGVVS